MDALELLKADHRKVKSMFEEVEQVEGANEKRQIFLRIKAELELHSFVEETIFYPAFSQYEVFKALLDISYDEHQEIKDLLEEIDELGEDEGIEAELQDLMDAVEQHVEEEEDEFFPLVRQTLNRNELELLGQRLEEAKLEQSKAA